MNSYRVTFRNGSSDIIDAVSASKARQKAEDEFGSKVSRVQILEDDDENTSDAEADDDDDE